MLAVLNQLAFHRLLFFFKDLIHYQNKDEGAPAFSVQPLPPVGLAYVGEESCSRLSGF